MTHRKLLVVVEGGWFARRTQMKRINKIRFPLVPEDDRHLDWLEVDGPGGGINLAPVKVLGQNMFWFVSNSELAKEVNGENRIIIAPVTRSNAFDTALQKRIQDAGFEIARIDAVKVHGNADAVESALMLISRFAEQEGLTENVMGY
jgi:hypothetical protein